jgi:tetratricopeptide (TPR) repeat protein
VLEKKKATVNKPIHLIVGLILAVVALGLAVCFYFWVPTPATSIVKARINGCLRLDQAGRELAKTKHYDEAIAKYSEALTINPGDYDLLMDRGRAYYDKKDFEAALTDYQFALSNGAKIEDKAAQEAGVKNALFGVALCQASLDRTQMAVKTLHELQAKDGHYIKSYQVLGDIYLKVGDSLAAIDAYTQGLRLNPNSSALHYDRSLAYLKRDMKDQEYEDLSRAVELDCNSLKMYLKHANMAQKMGKLEIADSDAQEILRLEPDNRSAINWLKKRKKPLAKGAEQGGKVGGNAISVTGETKK